MVAALKDDLQHLESNFEKVQKLQETFLTEMDGLNYYLNQSKEQLPYVLNIGFPGQRNDLLLLRMDLEGISISTGSACTAGIVQVSHVLQAFLWRRLASLTRVCSRQHFTSKYRTRNDNSC